MWLRDLKLAGEWDSPPSRLPLRRDFIVWANAIAPYPACISCAGGGGWRTVWDDFRDWLISAA